MRFKGAASALTGAWLVFNAAARIVRRPTDALSISEWGHSRNRSPSFFHLLIVEIGFRLL
jgi:hypothetical protein